MIRQSGNANLRTVRVSGTSASIKWRKVVSKRQGMGLGGRVIGGVIVAARAAEGFCVLLVRT